MEKTVFVERRRLFDELYDNEAITVKGIDIFRNFPAADVVSGRDFRDCRNELCLRCGGYERRHLGACDGCRWRNKG